MDINNVASLDSSGPPNICSNITSPMPAVTAVTADPNVFVYSNAIKMAIESLGGMLSQQISGSMNNVAKSMDNMAAVFEQSTRHPQVRSSYEDTCVDDARTPRSCSQDGVAGKPSQSASHAYLQDGASNVDIHDGFDFQNHGNATPSRQPPFSSLSKWVTKPNLAQSDDSPSKESVISIEAGAADEFDEAVNKLTNKHNDNNNNNNNNNSGDGTNTVNLLPAPVPQSVDNLYNTYMEEYQPDSMVGPQVSEDLAKTVNLFSDKKLSLEKLKERRLREMRPENVNLMMRTTNSTVFKLNCGDSSHARSTDIKLQHAEQGVVKATYPIIRAVDELQKLHLPALAPVINKLLDGIILLSDTVQEVEQDRRDLYKTVLPEAWKGLLAKPDGVHEELFGTMEDRLKECQRGNKLQEQVLEERQKELQKKPDKQSGKRKPYEYSGYSGYSGYSSQSKQPRQYPKNENRFSKPTRGPVGKRAQQKRDNYHRGRGSRR